MGFQFVFPAASAKTDYVNDSYTIILQFNTHWFVYYQIIAADALH